MKTITPREINAMRGYSSEPSNYEEVECEIESSDVDDGGAHYGIVVQDKATLLYYSFCINDWELGTRHELSESELDEGVEMTEVKQVSKTIITYE